MIIGNPIMLGGGSATVAAFIHVTYPAGSTCICTDGSKTLPLKDTSGQGLFYIPYLGQWKVKCYDGADYDSSDNKKYKDVEITSEGQSESVTLSYALDIFANGILAYPMEGLKNLSADTATVIIDGSEMVWTAVDSNNNGRAFNFTTTDKIDVTEYNTLNIEYIVETAAGMTEGRNFFGVAANKKASMGSADYGAATTFTTKPTGNYILSVPIDAITGQHYISAFAFLVHGATLKVRVSRLYLE